MATKKGAKKAAPQATNDWTKEEKRVFELLGVGEGDLSMRRLIRGQRKINGRLYISIELILDALKKSPPDRKKLELADAINEEIPGKEPPFCDDDGLP